MGGYGALKIGLRECDRFCMAAGLSSVTDPVIPVFSVDNKDVMTAVFGEEMVVPEMDDLFCLLEQRAKHPLRPRIFMGVGTEDFLYEDNIRLKNRLQELEYDYIYKESSGLHCWTFWDEYIIHVLNWMFRGKV